MFDKLRNKFLFLNMTIIFVVIILSFAAIYFSTYNTIKSQNQNKLNSPKITSIIPQRNDNLETIFSSILPPDFSLSFNLLLDKKGNLLKIDSFIDMPNDSYTYLASKAFNEGKDYKVIKKDGKKWMYKINKLSKTEIGSEKMNIANIEADYRITFLDITESMNTLNNLFMTFVLVAIPLFIIIYIISLNFANKAIKPIKSVFNKQKQFIADASHELKTPLTIISANVDALLLNKNDKTKNKWINYIKSETIRMDKLINELLYLAKTENQNFEYTIFNISEEVLNIILSVEAIIYEKGIKLQNNIEKDIMIKTDLEKIKQLVIILIDNAIKYTEKNGYIDINLSKDNKQLIFSIENSDSYIEKQEQEKIFDRFYRGDKSRNRDGGSYGLGLSIAKTIIEKLGGKIVVKSEKNKSTIFTFYLNL